MLERIGCAALALVIASAALRAQGEPTARVSGTVVDSGGRPVEAVEIDAAMLGRSARTDSAGRFTLGGLLTGRTRLVARRLGWRAIDTTIVIDTSGRHEVRLVLARVPQELQAVHIVSQDECPIRTLEGFECRRRGGIGAYRDSAEIAAIKPVCVADIVYGMEGMRRVPGVPCPGFESTEGWRCLVTLVDGHRMNAANAPPALMSEYIGVEFYAHYADVPEWYKQDAYAEATQGSPTRAVRGRATQFRQPSLPGRSCALLVYWTRRAKRYVPGLDQSRATTRAMQARRDSLLMARLDSIAAWTDSLARKKPPR